MIPFLVAALLATATAASAQEPAATFEALSGRLQIGQVVWVTDPTGREARGTLERLTSEELVLNGDRAVTFAAAAVQRVRTRDRDSIRNGTLIGLGVGGAMGTAWCIGAIADDSGDIDARVECAEGFTVFPALGALVGLAVDAVIPGTMRVVYQASSPRETARARLMLTPLVSARVTGMTLMLAF
jgi:hypothetical protein